MFVAPQHVAERPLELIEREIESLAAQINAGSARWLELVAEFDRRTGWGGTGCRSTAEWVAWRCALTPRSAREHVRVARALGQLPQIREGFARGELSYSKVRALTRVADAESEGDLIELARHATAAQLERMVRAARRATAAEADQQQRESYLRWFWDDADGCLHIDAKLPAEDGALFLRALESTRDGLLERRLEEIDTATDSDRDEDDGSAGPPAAVEPGGSAEPSSSPPREPALPPLSPWDSRFARAGSPTNAESFTALAEAALARPPTGVWDHSSAERYQVVVQVDAETLATDSPGAGMPGQAGACAIADGPGIAPETARRIACDAALIPLIERDGRPLSVGRRTRSVPPAIRRALTARDGRCQFPGCERHRFVDAHHIVHWSRGGETSLDNLVLLCRHHHRLVHEGGYSLSVSADGSHVFRDPAEREIPASPPLPTHPPPPLAPTNRRTLTGTGEGMNLGYCVDAVLVATGAT